MRQRGISLVEVIVALVIISTFGASLFVWAAQASRTASSAISWLDRLRMEANADALAQSLNPALRPNGHLETAEHRYEWLATPLRAEVSHVNHPAGLSPYEVAVFKVHVRVLTLEDGRELLSTEHQVASFRQARVRATPPGFGSTAP